MLALDNNLALNVASSVERFLNDNIVTPYNTAVTGTQYSTHLRIILPPQDLGTIAAVPAIVMPDFPRDSAAPASGGVGSGIVWRYSEFDIEVYPAFYNDTSGATKSSVESAQLLQSLFSQVATANFITMYDYSIPATPVAKGSAYVVDARAEPTRGAIKMLALHRNRFNFILKIRYEVPALNG